jgi:hypothetical protein
MWQLEQSRNACLPVNGNPVVKWSKLSKSSAAYVDELINMNELANNIRQSADIVKPSRFLFF